MKYIFSLAMSFFCLIHLLFAESFDDFASLAFDVREVVSTENLALCPDGKIIAYSARQRPSALSINRPSLIDGTPAESVGSRVYLYYTDAHRTHVMDSSLLGDSWLPVWSQDGAKVAFYSNVNKKVQLWVYDLSQKRSKVMGTLPITTAHFAQYAPQWSLDGKKLYVFIDAEEEGKKSANDRVKIYSCKKTEETTLQHLVVFDVESGKMSMLQMQTTSPATLKISPTGMWLAYLSSFSDGSPTGLDLMLSSSRISGQSLKIDKNLKEEEASTNLYVWHPTQDLLVYIKDNGLYCMQIDENHHPYIRVTFSIGARC